MARLDINAIRRRQIIEAAVAVMAEKGWAETSIDEATKRAEVSRGLVSYHFKDKADLLSGVLARCQEIFNESVAEAIESSQDPVEQMRRVLEISIELAVVNPVPYEVFVQFTASAKRDPRLGDEIRALWDGFRKTTARAIAHGQRQGVFRGDIDPMVAATRQIGAVTGIALQWLLEPGAFDFNATKRETVDMLMRALVADGVDIGGRRGAAEAAVGLDG
ncbi:TetR/AcrR family transcriptional regulator [Tepidiforma sp.]|uniref:TetR/AcrR family transcriptional regulator n=1 Tax=Tepidiforma sp. TaxID=2682230 RepID=UPI002ADE203B|nr:TetR/AcrR family transcriptional regulator [Tepidiforma sp.]